MLLSKHAVTTNNFVFFIGYEDVVTAVLGASLILARIALLITKYSTFNILFFFNVFTVLITIFIVIVTFLLSIIFLVTIIIFIINILISQLKPIFPSDQGTIFKHLSKAHLSD